MAITTVIRPYSDCTDLPGVREAMRTIFFESAATRSFASDDARAAYESRWLGRYLEAYPAHAFLAFDGGTEVIGYLVGSLRDPARDLLFEDIPYFQDLAALTPAYPAHLHINLAPAARGHGIGGRLIRAFEAHAAAHDVAGVHVVTGGVARNRSFYQRLGYREVWRGTWGTAPLVMLGHKLG